MLVADLGATYLRIGLAVDGEISALAVHRTAELARNETEGIAPAVVERLAEAWAAGHADGGSSPRAVGVGVAAYVSRDGVVLQRRAFGLMEGPELRDRLAARLECPIAIDNDANMAVLAELVHGAGRGCCDFLLLTLGTNIGMGIVVDGRVMRGAHGAAGEPGYLLVPASRGRAGRSPFARAARFGSGVTDAPPGYAWLEDLAGGGALARAFAAANEASGDTPTGPDRAERRVFARALAGDRRARTIANHAIESWAMLIADLVALFDPERIVLSGGLVEDLRPFLEPLRRRAADLSPLAPDVRIGELGAQAGLVGAAVAARTLLRARTDPAVKASVESSAPQSGPDQRPIVTGR